MGEDRNPTDVAQRLRHLQAKHGQTIQEMAQRCGLPKRSLENYMNLKGPQRPGLDALISIADGYCVSVDWLVGRDGEAEKPEFTKEDYAVFCHGVVLCLLHDLIGAEAKEGGAIDPTTMTVMGLDMSQLAAVTMLQFLGVVERQSNNPNRPAHYFSRNIESLRLLGTEGSFMLNDTISGSAERKP